MGTCDTYHPEFPVPVDINTVNFGVITPTKAKVWIDRNGEGVPQYYYTLTETAMRRLVSNEADVLRSWKQHRSIIEFYRNSGVLANEQVEN